MSSDPKRNDGGAQQVTMHGSELSEMRLQIAHSPSLRTLPFGAFGAFQAHPDSGKAESSKS